MKAYTYFGAGRTAFADKPKPVLLSDRDAIVRVTALSICTSDLHIKHGFVPRAVPGVTLGHEFVGTVESAGSAVGNVAPGDRVAVNVETFCGECFFCRRGSVNNCSSPLGGWSLGCRIDGAQTEYVRVPFADTGLTEIPDGVTDRQALLTGDVLATGYWAADIADISEGDTVLVIGGGPVGICCAECARLRGAGRVVVHRQGQTGSAAAFYGFGKDGFHSRPPSFSTMASTCARVLHSVQASKSTSSMPA